MSEPEEVPLFDMDTPPKRKPAPERKGVSWLMLKHSRFTCQQCVAFLGTDRADGIKAARFLRQDFDDPHHKVITSVYCLIHAETQKREDQKNGVWAG